MSVRSLNKVMLIGNLTRDPELRYTPSGTAVCSFGVATNRAWTTDGGERKEETEFHRIVSWNKLAELCSQLLSKGRKVFVEGRLQTRSWQGQDGTQRTTTEIVIDDMIVLDSRRVEMTSGTTAIPTSTSVTPPPVTGQTTVPTGNQVPVAPAVDSAQAEGEVTDTAKSSSVSETSSKKSKTADEPAPSEDINPDDIPF